MRFKILLILTGIFLFRTGSGQYLTDSNLPIVVISTDNGAEIRDAPRIRGTMKIIYRSNGERNYISDQNDPAMLNYSGRIEIEIRGSSSASFDKKQYGFSTLMPDNVTEENVSLLCLPEDNDWILNCMVFDTAMMRDYLSYSLSRRIGEYASRTVYCEVVINENYRGLYLLQEKIKAGQNRVNVHKIEPADNLMPEVTGGYITKTDKTTGGDPVAWGMGGDFIHVLPDPAEVTPEQGTYIYHQFTSFSNAADNNNSSITTGFPHFIDIPSFIDYMIIQELASNADAYQFSTYFHKDRNGKLRAGPLWDNDLTYGNDLFLWGYDRSKTNVWQFSNGDNEGPGFWKDLFHNDVFRCYMSKRWNELIQPGQPLNLATLSSFIDTTADKIREAGARNYYRWGISTSFDARVNFIKEYLAARISWITANIGPYDACSYVPVPPLIISKIMYNPPASPGFAESKDLEFIEIKNDGDEATDLSGVYFAGTGFVFQFPENSSVAPHGSVFLAGNSSIFTVKYGFAPSGQFTRNLSDKGQDLILADGYGNTIDRVSYTDTIPWPEADGNGSYLRLKDLNLDNNIASSWTASNTSIIDDGEIPADMRLTVFPNPTATSVRIINGTEISSVTLFDLSGRQLFSAEVNSKEIELDLSTYPRGIYFIRAVTANGSSTRKIIKE